MGDVIKGTFKTMGPLSVDGVLASASEANLKETFVLGWDKEGHFYTVSTTGSKPELLFLLALAYEWIMEE